MELNTVILHLGSNIGDINNNLRDAINNLKLYVGRISNISSFYETAAWGIEDQPSFINIGIKLTTHLSPNDLLKRIHFIEKKLGRVRLLHWGERLIDIDIIYFNNLVYNSTQLTIPHIYMHTRNFVLVPLIEICPKYLHPIYHKTPQELLNLCQDTKSVTSL